MQHKYILTFPALVVSTTGLVAQDIDRNMRGAYLSNTRSHTGAPERLTGKTREIIL